MESKASLALVLVACTTAPLPPPAKPVVADKPPAMHKQPVIRPLIVLLGDGQGLVIGCTRDGKAIAAAACGPYLNEQLAVEIVGMPDVKIHLGKKHGLMVCPSGSSFDLGIDVIGIPADHEGEIWVVAKGTKASIEDSEESLNDAAERVHGKPPEIRPEDHGWPTYALVDYDGDGAYELVSGALGSYQIFARNGEQLAYAACTFG